MTGITKDELMQMAHEAGLIDFYNAILERAAVELEGAWHTAEAAESIRALKINTGD